MNTPLKIVVTQGRSLPLRVGARMLEGPPDVQLVVRPWYVRVLVRFAYVYLSVFLGLWIGADFVPQAGDMFPLLGAGQKALVVAQLALLSAAPLVLKNVVTFLGDLDQKFPDLAS